MIFHLNILTIYGLIMNEKKIAAEYSVNYIEDGMIVGLGTGSTVEYMIHKLSERVKAGLNITAVSTSAATTKLLLHWV